MNPLAPRPASEITPALEGLEEAWLEALAKDYSRETVAAYSKGLRLFRDWLTGEGLTLATVTPGEVVRWRESLKAAYAVSTVNLWLSAVRSFYGWLIEQGAPIVNPAKVRGATRRGQATLHKRGELTNGEVVAVLRTCDETPRGKRDRAVLSLMAYCALRTVEIQRADIGDLDARDGRPILWVKGKGHTDRDDYVVLPAPAEAALLEWLAVRPVGEDALFVGMGNRNRGRLTLRQLRAIIGGRYQEAGVRGEKKSAHSLRHSAISNALRHGASPLEVQAMARHKSMDTTLVYVHELRRLANPAEDKIVYGEDPTAAMF